MATANIRLSPVETATSAARPVARRWPVYEPDEIAAVTRVLESGRVNSLVHGDETRAFEEEFAAYCGAPHAIAVSNGTTALELAMRALNIGLGDEVIVPARSFFATAASVVAVGATPVFADIDPVTQNIDVNSVWSMVRARTRAVLCVHLAGRPCDMAALSDFTRPAGLWLIEDCAQAHGAAIDGRRVGSFGDAAAFSFCTDKIMSTGGEGGMLLLREHAHWARAWAYKDHGKNPDKVFAPNPGFAFRHVHDSFGTNWRMTEMQAAIGRRQLAKLPRWLAQRRRNAMALMRLLADDPRIVLSAIPDGVDHAFYRLYLTIAPEALGPAGTTDAIIKHMVESGVAAGSGSCADMSLEKAFDDLPVRRAGDLAVATALGKRTIALPVDHLLDEGDMARTADALRAALSAVGEEAAA